MTVHARFRRVPARPPSRRSPCCASAPSPSARRRRCAFADAAARRPARRVDTSVVGLRQGDAGPGVQAVQQKLIVFGYYVADGADGHFGAGTTAALRVFQQQNGLNPTGVVTETDGALSRARRGVPASGAAQCGTAAGVDRSAGTAGSVVGLRRGTTGPAVRQLQLAILATGLYLSGGADGTFGSSTHRGVTLVQRVNGLPETGVVDAATARVLGLTGSASSPSAPAPAGTVVQVGASGASVQRVQQLLDQVRHQRRRRRRRRVRPADAAVSCGLPDAARPRRRPARVDAATDAALVKAANRRQLPPPAAERRRRTSDCASAPPGRRSPSCSRRSWPPASSCAAVPTASSASRRAPPCSIYQRVNGLSADRRRRRGDGAAARPAHVAGGGGGSRQAGGRRRPASPATTSAAPASSPCRRR